MKNYYFKTPFAASGDVTTIPRSAQSDGSISYSQGWGPDYQKDLKTQATAKAVGRSEMNAVLNAITAALGQYQQQGVPEFITTADNDGTPYAYGLGAEVIYNGQYWVSLQANNTTTPGSGNSWQTVLYRVATDAEVDKGTDSRTFIVPSNLKTQLDARDTKINQNISQLAQTVAQNKADQQLIDEGLSTTIAANTRGVAANVKSIEAINARKINNKTFSGDITLNADDVGAVPKTGTNQITGNLEAQGGSSVQFIPTDYRNFDYRYGADLNQNVNGFWRDHTTGFTIQWGIVSTSANNDYGTYAFHTKMQACFSVSVNVFGSQGTSETSDKNLLLSAWDGNGFTVYTGKVERQVCYQAMGIVN